MSVMTPDLASGFGKFRKKRKCHLRYHRNSGDPFIGAFRDFLTFLAKMGLSVKDDPRKVVDIAGRKWGDPVNGLALSALLKPKEDPDELPSISVAIHNRGTQPRRLHMRGWLSFYEVSVIDFQGEQAMLTSFGAELRKPESLPAPSEVALPAGEATEADIPIGSIFVMPRGRYRVRVSCAVPERVVSNEVEVEV